MSGLDQQLEETFNQLLTSNFQEKLFADLTNQRKDGRNNIKADCPYCGGNDFSYSKIKPLYQCWNCGESGNWLTYLQEIEGMEKIEAIKFLADKAGVELTDFEVSDEYQRKLEERELRDEVLELTQEYVTKALWTPEGEEVSNYLHNRGYSKQEIKEMGLGAYVDRSKLKEHLLNKGYNTKELNQAGLFTGGRKFGFGITHKLTMLLRDSAGRALGLICRRIDDIDDNKYFFSHTTKGEVKLLGLTKTRGCKSVTVVEGVLDAVYLNSKGIATVSLGGASILNNQIKALENAGIEEVLLCLDDDKRGRQGTERVLQSLKRFDLRAYVVSLPEQYKDPDELVRNKGVDAFKIRLKNAQRWSEWMADYILYKYDDGTPRGQDKVIEDLLSYYSKIEDPIDKKFFKDEIKQLTNLTDKELSKQLKSMKLIARKRKIEDNIKATIELVKNKVDNNDIIGAKDELSQGLKEVKINSGTIDIEPYLINDFLNDINNTTPSLKTGINTLDKKVRIPNGALTFIAGRPGHGKTTLMLNIFMNMIKLYDKKSFYFFSYEEGRDKLVVKLIINLAGVNLSDNFNFGAYINYLKTKRNSQPNSKIEKALKNYKNYTHEGRLWVVDNTLNAEDLVTTIIYLAGQEDVGAVFIDYIQNIPPSKRNNQRYLEIKRISELLRDTARDENIPIIVGAQAKRGSKKIIKKGDMREGGDIEQDANLIMGLYNEAEVGVDEDGDPLAYEEPVNLIINIAKGRQIGGGQKFQLAFNRPILKISDKNFSKRAQSVY